MVTNRKKSSKPAIKRIAPGFLMPSAAYTVPRKLVRLYDHSDSPPQVGDLVYGRIKTLGQHHSLENKQGRIHMINTNTKAVFVYGNRYAPDYYEGVIPDHITSDVDLLARSGIVGKMLNKNAAVITPTQVRVLGYVCDNDGKVINTRDFNLIKPKGEKQNGKRAKLILVVGTSMNSGKSMTAVAACWALNSMGYCVRASKVTGTASLKDILHMEDAGAAPTTDFSFMGYPSTYMLSSEELHGIFNTLDLKYANNPRNYWVVELADGILQRETAMLLGSPEIQSRIHRLLFASQDALGCIGGIEILRSKFGLIPDAISGICSSSPLSIRELQEYTSLPVFSNTQLDLNVLADILL